jgi:hypothetical protein
MIERHSPFSGKFGSLVAVSLLASQLAWSADEWSARSAASRAEEGFDRSIGIWFPPGAPRATYLAGGDPKHSIAEDVRKRFEAEPELARAVCDLVMKWQPAVSSEDDPPRVKQLRTIFGMICLGRSAEESHRGETSKREKAAFGRFRARLEAEIAAVGDLDEEARLLEGARVAGRIGSLTDAPERFRQALRLVALSPMSFGSAYFVLREARNAEEPKQPLTADDVAPFLGRWYREKLESEPSRSSEWKRGLRNVAFLTGDLATARSLTAVVLEDPDVARHAFDWVFEGVLERVDGKRELLDRLLSRCPPPPPGGPPFDLNEDEPSYCRYCALTICNLGISSLRVKSPRPLLDVLEDLVNADRSDWPARMGTIRMVALLDPPRALEMFQEVLALGEEAPWGARSDSFQGLYSIHQERHEYALAHRAIESRLALHGWKRRAPTAAIWKRLADFRSEDFKGSSEDESGYFRMLLDRVQAALGLEDPAAIRAAIEDEIPAALELGYGGLVRIHLELLAKIENKAGHRAEALRIASFLAGNAYPKGFTTFDILVRDLTEPGAAPPELTPVSSPWPLNSEEK